MDTGNMIFLHKKARLYTQIGIFSLDNLQFFVYNIRWRMFACVQENERMRRQ